MTIQPQTRNRGPWSREGQAHRQHLPSLQPPQQSTNTGSPAFPPKPLISSNCCFRSLRTETERKWWEAGPQARGPSGCYSDLGDLSSFTTHSPPCAQQWPWEAGEGKLGSQCELLALGSLWDLAYRDRVYNRGHCTARTPAVSALLKWGRWGTGSISEVSAGQA